MASAEVWYEFLNVEQSAVPLRSTLDDAARAGRGAKLVCAARGARKGEWMPLEDARVLQLQVEELTRPLTPRSVASSESLLASPRDFKRHLSVTCVKTVPHRPVPTHRHAPTRRPHAAPHFEARLPITPDGRLPPTPNRYDPITGGLSGLPEGWANILPDGCVSNIVKEDDIPEVVRPSGRASPGLRLRDELIVGSPFNVTKW